MGFTYAFLNAARQGALHLHVTREHLADHGPFKHGLTAATARHRTTLHTRTATHSPSLSIARHTGATCAGNSGLNRAWGEAMRSAFSLPWRA